MKRYLLDTGAVGDYLNRRRGVYERAREAVAAGAQIGVGMPVLGELWSGVHLSTSRERNAARLKRQLRDFRIWPFDQAAAEDFGRLFAVLRRIGRPMQQIDIQTAAIARGLGDCTVVTSDSDFAAIPGLDVVDWSQAADTGR